MNERFSILPRSMKMRKDLSDSEKFLLSHVASFPDGCYQLKRTIAEELGWTISKVQRILAMLKKRGLVAWTFDGRKNNIRLFKNEKADYTELNSLNQICTPCISENAQSEDAKAHPIEYSLEHTLEKETISLAHQADLLGQPVSKPRPKRGRPKTGIDTNGYTREFEYFWAYYPRSDSKGAAFKAWQKINPTPELAAEITQVVRLRARGPDWANREKRFIPHASTWLNAAGWQDGFELAKEDQIDN